MMGVMSGTCNCEFCQYQRGVYDRPVRVVGSRKPHMERGEQWTNGVAKGVWLYGMLNAGPYGTGDTMPEAYANWLHMQYSADKRYMCRQSGVELERRCAVCEGSCAWYVGPQGNLAAKRKGVRGK